MFGRSLWYAIGLVTFLLDEAQQFGWYKFANKCYISGDALYLEAWKVDKCDNFTDTLIFDNCRIIKIEDDAFVDLDTTYLSLDNNNLKTIDDWLAPLTQLEYFSMNHNRIKKLEKKNFVQLKKLQLLSLTNNEINSIDLEAFVGLDKLQFLSLAHNQVKTIHTEYASVPNILQLDFSHNQIEHVQENAFKNCTKIGEIQLSYNNLKTLPDNFFLRSVLQRIYLTNNQLERADFLKDCVNMDTIDLSHNKFQELTFVNLLKLDTLYLHYNQLEHTTIKEIIANHSSTLRWISFNSNRLSCLGLVELWSDLQSGSITIMDNIDYKANVKINEIGCDTTPFTTSEKPSTTTTTSTAGYVFFYQKERLGNYEFL